MGTQEYEVEGMRRSAAMAPLDPASVERLVRSHGELSQNWSESKGCCSGWGQRGPSCDRS
jgi:hypothetical protein